MAILVQKVQWFEEEGEIYFQLKCESQLSQVHTLLTYFCLGQPPSPLRRRIYTSTDETNSSGKIYMDSLNSATVG